MPNPGGMYLGCETCRRRKIKCDRSFPQCQRCVKHGSTCPGYPREQDVRFRDETGKFLRPAQAQNSTPESPSTSSLWERYSHDVENLAHSVHEHDSPSLYHGGVPLNEPTIRAVSLVSSLNPSWVDVLTEYFFNQVLLPVGWYSHLPQLHSRTLPSSCMRATITAASLFLAANQFADASMLHLARGYYGNALQTLNNNLTHPDRCLEDETLSTILLLNVLDDVAGQTSFVSDSHLNGCAQLIRLQEAKQIQTRLSQDLVYSVIIQTQPHLTQDYTFGVLAGSNESVHTWLLTQTPLTPAAAVSALSLNLGNMIHAASSLLADDTQQPNDGGSLVDMMRDLIALDTGAMNWLAHGDPRWVRKSAVWYTPGGEEIHADYYADVQVAKVWNHWRLARILLHDTLMKIIEHLESITSVELDQNLRPAKIASLKAIGDMMTDMFASIPFHLQQLDATGRPSTQQHQKVLGGCALIAPLEVVIKCKRTPLAMKHQVGEVLRIIGAEIGVKQALVLHESVFGSAR